MLAPAMARLKGLEPLAHCLEGSCSIHLSYRRVSRRPPPQGTPARKGFRLGAGDGNRTHATSLEGWDSTIELHPHRSDGLNVSLSMIAYPAFICQSFFCIFSPQGSVTEGTALHATV